jgi:hypothetical protein
VREALLAEAADARERAGCISGRDDRGGPRYAFAFGSGLPIS